MKTDTTLACTFLEDLHREGPWTLAAGHVAEVCADRAEAATFIRQYSSKHTVCVLLGPLKDSPTGAPTSRDLKFCRWVAVELPASAKAAIEAHHKPPHLWISGPRGTAIAGWKMILAEYTKPKEVEASLKAFAQQFAADHGCTCEPLMLAIPVRPPVRLAA